MFESNSAAGWEGETAAAVASAAARAAAVDLVAAAAVDPAAAAAAPVDPPVAVGRPVAAAVAVAVWAVAARLAAEAAVGTAAAEAEAAAGMAVVLAAGTAVAPMAAAAARAPIGARQAWAGVGTPIGDELTGVLLHLRNSSCSMYVLVVQYVSLVYTETTHNKCDANESPLPAASSSSWLTLGFRRAAACRLHLLRPINVADSIHVHTTFDKLKFTTVLWPKVAVTCESDALFPDYYYYYYYHCFGQKLPSRANRMPSFLIIIIIIITITALAKSCRHVRIGCPLSRPSFQSIRQSP